MPCFQQFSCPLASHPVTVIEPLWDVMDKPDSDLEDNQVTKKIFYIISVGSILNFLKAKLDNTIEEIVTKLSNKYPPGLCELHLDLPCFHHPLSNLHFNLDCS